MGADPGSSAASQLTLSLGLTAVEPKYSSPANAVQTGVRVTGLAEAGALLGAAFAWTVAAL